MKISHAVALALSLSVMASPALGQAGGNDIPGWEAGAQRDAKEGKIKEGVLKLSIESVRRVQQALVARGHVIKEIDGTLNQETEDALEKFQSINRFKESGDITVETLNALGSGVAVMIATDVKGTDFARSEMARATGEATVVRAGMPIDVNVNGKGETEPLGYVVLGKDQIKAMQKRFASEKLYSGEKDGSLTTEFIVAVRSFQAAKGLKTTSLIDLPTLALIPEVEVNVELTGKLAPSAPGEAQGK